MRIQIEKKIENRNNTKLRISSVLSLQFTTNPTEDYMFTMVGGQGMPVNFISKGLLNF